MSDSPIASTPVVTEQAGPGAPALRSRKSGTMPAAIVVAILGAGVLLTALTTDVTKVSEPGVRLLDGSPFLADKVGDWAGTELQGLSEIEKKLLPPDTEGARRTFTDGEGHQLFCSIVLAGRDATSIHRPELCLPGQGWNIQNEFVQPLPVPAAPGGSLSVMKMNATRSIPLADGRTGQYHAIFVYWFIGKDCMTARHWQRIYWTTRDRVLHNTNHRWAYILISTPVSGETTQGDRGKSPEQAMQILSTFVRDLYPTLIEK